jgi:hypothetical protein
MLITALVFGLLSFGILILMRLLSWTASSGVRQHVLERWGTYEPEELVKIRNSPKDKELYLSLLFPLDVFFMVAFGIFLALVSIGAANSMKSSCAIFGVVAPVLYVVADFTENCLLYRMLKAVTPPDESLIAAAHRITRAKWFLAGVASLQAILLFVFSKT